MANIDEAEFKNLIILRVSKIISVYFCLCTNKFDSKLLNILSIFTQCIE